MTAHENQIPLMARFSKKLKRQRAQDDGTNAVTFDVPATNGGRRRPSYARADSVRERYNRLEVGSARKYTVELLQATEEQNYEFCRQLLEKGANVNSIDVETGVTALHIAAKHDSYDILRLLLDKGADSNAQDKTEQAPLHLAVKKDHIFSCQILLECADLQVNICNKAHDTPLHHAAKEGRYEICSMLLNHPSIKVNAKNRKGMTPLHYAAQENQDRILQLLLDNHVDWKLQDSHRYLAVHYAAQKGFQDCVRVLIQNVNGDDRKQQLKVCLKDGKTPLMLAAKGGHHLCCEIMEYGNIKAKDKQGNTALHLAAQGGYDCTVSNLLKAGADPNTQNLKGSAPVLEAAGKKKFGCLRILAENGADLKVFDKQNKTVLHYAAERNALETLKYLLTFPVLIGILDTKDNSKCTPLHLAIKREASDSALVLLENGASPTEQCAGGMTPLHLAADKGFTSVCEFLLSKKEVQVSQENDVKATPLHMAALHGSTDVCQMLIRKGARLTAVDGKGRTALHVASAEGYANVVKFLSKKGIPQKARDDTGSSALHLAAVKGSLECCKVLVSCAKATSWEIDHSGDLPLDRAFKENTNCKIEEEELENHDKVFQFLLMHLCYREQEDRMLRIHKYMDKALEDKRVTVIDAIINSCWWKAGVSGENGHQCPNFRLLIENYPCIALKLQDKCITHCKETNSKVTYDFRLFEDNYYIPSAVGNLVRCPFDDETHRVMSNAVPFTKNGLKWKQNHPVSLMISHQRHHLLHHPLTKTWLWQKWNSYMYIIILLLLLIELLFAICLVSFMGMTDNWLHVEEKCNLTKQEFCNIADSLSENATLIQDNEVYDSMSVNTTSENITLIQDLKVSRFKDCNKHTNGKHILWILLLLLTTFTVLLELNYVLRLKKEYFFQAEHILQIMRAAFTIAILVPGGYCEFNYVILNVMHWQCGIVALLLTWLHLINTLNQLPMLSVFMPVTGSFAKSFFKVIFYIIMIIFIFAFSFHLLLKDQDAFSTVPQALVKTIVWMLGDLAYDDTFLTEQKVEYPIMVNLLFVVFVTILGGFIANLIITQPANKLDDFRDKASFHRAASRTLLFLKLDICFPFFRKRRTIGSYTDDESKKIDYSFFSKKLLMLDNKEEIQPTPVDPVQTQLEELNKQFVAFMAQHSEYRDEVRDLKHQINFLSKALLEQKQQC